MLTAGIAALAETQVRHGEGTPARCISADLKSTRSRSARLTLQRCAVKKAAALSAVPAAAMADREEVPSPLSMPGLVVLTWTLSQGTPRL